MTSNEAKNPEKRVEKPNPSSLELGKRKKSIQWILKNIGKSTIKNIHQQSDYVKHYYNLILNNKRINMNVLKQIFIKGDLSGAHIDLCRTTCGVDIFDTIIAMKCNKDSQPYKLQALKCYVGGVGTSDKSSPSKCDKNKKSAKKSKKNKKKKSSNNNNNNTQTTTTNNNIDNRKNSGNNITMDFGTVVISESQTTRDNTSTMNQTKIRFNGDGFQVGLQVYSTPNSHVTVTTVPDSGESNNSSSSSSSSSSSDSSNSSSSGSSVPTTPSSTSSLTSRSTPSSISSVPSTPSTPSSASSTDYSTPSTSSSSNSSIPSSRSSTP